MTGDARAKLLRSCTSFLLPVARFLLRAGVSYREFSEVSRRAFVRAASEDFGVRGRPTNISRISAMTGISRKDIARIRNESDEGYDIRIELSPLGDLLHYWCTDPAYLNVDGSPKRLHITEGDDSFADLVRKRVGDVPVGALKSELLRCGAVRVDSNEMLAVCRRYIVPEDSGDKLSSSISYSLRNLAETIAFNSSPDRKGPGRIERFVQSSRLDREGMQELRPLIRRKIATVCEEIDSIFFRHEGSSTADGLQRVGVGMFYCEDVED
jgi:Family of unknown function (DUF6502)